MTTASAATDQINITFHGVGEPDRALEPGEEAVWLAADHFASVLDAIGAHDRVQITFDDGNASDVRVALPALRDRGLRATFFVVADRIGAEGYLSADDIESLRSHGMTIGCHGMRHRSWRGLDDDALREELHEARGRLEEITGSPVTHAACPFGAYDRRALGALRRYGYQRVFTSDGGDARPRQWLQARTTIRKCDRPEDLERHLFAQDGIWGGLARRSKRLVKQWR